ncbi:MAG: adenylate/guanylate cyclase domain-containing protein [Labilibaculum antarcticum]
MKVNTNISYDFNRSIERLDEILDSSENFDEVSEIPNSDRLTYRNGFYLNCYSIFIDIRDSSELPEKYLRKTLAKIYRSFISEIVAIYQSYSNCKEINIVGDCVWGVFNAKQKEDVLAVFSAGYSSNSLVNALNYKLCKKGIKPIRIGIGISKGRALMIKAGFNGSSINDVIWMGDVVNQASKMCSKANKEVSSTMVISKNVYDDLSGYDNGEQEYQSFFTKKITDTYYHGDIIRIEMNKWLNDKKISSPCSL